MVELNEQERAAIESFIRRGKANARNITRAHVLLKSAEGRSISDLAKIKATIDWRFTTGDARSRLHRLYPKLLPL